MSGLTLPRHTQIAAQPLAETCGGHLSHEEVASKVRMLMRGDLDHEAVCNMGRDRIVWLAGQVESLQAKLDNRACGNGHNNVLPLVLWDCPMCHQRTKDKLARLIAAAEAALVAGVLVIDDEPNQLREAIAFAKGITTNGGTNG